MAASGGITIMAYKGRCDGVFRNLHAGLCDIVWLSAGYLMKPDDLRKPRNFSEKSSLFPRG